MQKTKRSYKKIVAGWLFLLAGIPLFFTMLFLVKQQLAQHFMFEKMEQGYVSTYRFSTNDFYWIKEGKELLIKGKLFDVKSFTVTSDSITVTGLFDEEEEQLKTTYLQMAHSKNDLPTPLQLLLLKSFFSPAFTVSSHLALSLQYILVADKILPVGEEEIVTMFYPILIPPPRNLS